MSIKVAIDAGHGRYTEGHRCLKSLDPKETREWQLNERIARFAILKLNAAGIQTLRVDDPTGATDVALKTRTDKANNAKCDYYISIHADAGINGGNGGGITAFCYPKGSKAAFTLRDAVCKHAVTLTGLKGNRSTPKTTMNLHVCRETIMPAILVEFGFMDSKNDVPVILTDRFAQNAAEGILLGICEVTGIKLSGSSTPMQELTAKPRKRPVVIDGRTYHCDVIELSGTNYVKLRAFEQAGYTVGYGKASDTPSICAPIKA